MEHKREIIIIYSSNLTKEENIVFEKHVSNTVGTKHRIIGYENFNQYSLSEIYNNAIDEHYNKNSIFVMCHNDIIFKTKNWGKVLLRKFNNNEYDIIGVAGTTYMPDSGRWWDKPEHMEGIVEHTDGDKIWESRFSKKPIIGVKPVVILDGLFISFNPDTIENKFDEEFKGFHFYDLGFTFPNYLDGCNIGVTTDIRILHKSIGKTNDEWEENRIQFVDKYKDELPYKHIPDKLNILITCQFFKNYTGSELYVYELSKELNNLGCNVSVVSGVVGEPLKTMAKKNKVSVYSIHGLYNAGKEFDIIHINHKPIGEQILRLFPNTPAIMQIHSEVIPTFEEPILNNNILKYLSVRESISEYIKTFNIDNNEIIEVDNPIDSKRFNTDYKKNENEKKIVLFIGTLDHLRKNMLIDLVEMTKKNEQLLWIIGADSNGYAKDLKKHKNVTYYGVRSNVEDFIKKCDYTAGIFKGRSTLEGYMCGKKGWIYTVDKQGNVLDKKLTEIPDDLYRYNEKYTTKKILNIYNEVLRTC